MAITLVSSVPAEASTDYFLNKSIELVFNKAISTASLTNNVFSIVDIDSGTSVPLTITLSTTSSSKVFLLPSTSLKENTQYRILIVGLDMDLGYSLVAEDTDILDTTIFIEFSTGESVYKIDTTVQKDVISKTLEGDVFLPTNVKALGYDFVVDKIRPKNNTHSVPVSLTGDSTIRFTFTKNLYTGAVDFDDWISVSVFPILNDPAYLASGQVLGEVPIPDHSISVNDNQLVVTFNADLPNNAAIHIDISNKITSEDGEELGGELKYSANTALYPQIYGVDIIKREVKELTTVYTDDYIGAILFKNTIWTWEKVGRSFRLDDMPFAAKQYIIYSTILDLMEDAEYTKYLSAGTKRQLGDLSVSIDNISGKVAMKVAKYQKLKDLAFESMNKGWQFRVGVSAAYDNLAVEINRLWYDVSWRYTDTKYSYNQYNFPAANATENRRARSNNPIW